MIQVIKKTTFKHPLRTLADIFRTDGKTTVLEDHQLLEIAKNCHKYELAKLYYGIDSDFLKVDEIAEKTGYAKNSVKQWLMRFRKQFVHNVQLLENYPDGSLIWFVICNCPSRIANVFQRDFKADFATPIEEFVQIPKIERILCKRKGFSLKSMKQFAEIVEEKIGIQIDY